MNISFTQLKIAIQEKPEAEIPFRLEIDRTWDCRDPILFFTSVPFGTLTVSKEPYGRPASVLTTQIMWDFVHEHCPDGVAAMIVDGVAYRSPVTAMNVLYKGYMTISGLLNSYRKVLGQFPELHLLDCFDFYYAHFSKRAVVVHSKKETPMYLLDVIVNLKDIMNKPVVHDNTYISEPCGRLMKVVHHKQYISKNIRRYVQYSPVVESVKGLVDSVPLLLNLSDVSDEGKDEIQNAVERLLTVVESVSQLKSKGEGKND